MTRENLRFGFDGLPQIVPGREAQQYEFSLRLLAFLLRAWQTFNETADDDGRVQTKPLTAIYFDKLAMLVFRVWKALYSEQEQAAVRLQVPFRERPGKHGPGPAIDRPNAGPCYITQLVYECQQLGVLRYFDVRVVGGSPTHHETEVLPALPPTEISSLFSDCTATEIEAVSQLENSIKRLSRDEIRALGTHETEEKTVMYVRREFEYMAPNVRSIEGNLDSTESFSREAQIVLEFANEALRKSSSTGNRQPYKAGRDALLKEAKSGPVRKAIERSQHDDRSIWESAAMKRLETASTRAGSIARYLKATGQIKDKRIKSRDAKVTKRENEELAKAAQRLMKSNCGALPSTANALFEMASPKLREAAVGQFRELLSKLRLVE